MSTQTVNNKNLSYQYDWFQKTFPPVVQDVFDNFFEQDFKFSLLGVCKNVNSIVDKAAYFVTKVKIDKQHDLFFRISETSIGLILEKVLGRPNNPFDLNKLTELETKIITTFNDCLFRAVVGFLKPAPPTLARTNFDVIYLVFVLTDQESGKSGRFVITLPDVLLEPEAIPVQEEFSVDHFEQSTISVRLDIGRTVFKLHDVKHLEVDDMVVFENSNTDRLRLSFRDWETDVLLKPNLSLVVPIDNDGGSEVSENENINIWDSIEVEMVGHFDAVDITLGELKKIQAGMVVDLASIYQNKVTLTVEDKPIASGELVIINDKYGVKITEVHAPKPVEENYAPVSNEAQDDSSIEPQEGGNDDFPEVSAGGGNDDEEEFDYSDFDLEEDI
ncbi:MAG: FliM/FliN family flagellar motor switch protein [Fusobacterium sp.]|nr:FliM/FliN family flagellar motor switch protein [Fusobacterium sp.]